MANSLFSQIPISKPKRNFFDLSHDVKMTLDMGRLYPTMWLECYPGDSISVGCTMQLRFAPLIAPVMHSINWYVHYFFVPYRILWSNWEKYYQSPTDDSGDPAPVWPYLVLDQLNSIKGSLYDYMGCPPIGVSDAAHVVNINAMPFAAYNKIWKDYYEDENLYDPDSVQWQLVDGDNTVGIPNALWPFYRAWEKDYFTSALPFAQKGPVVTIPLGTLEDVRVFTQEPTSTTNTWAGSSVSATSAPTRPSTNTGIPNDQLYANTENVQINSSTINDWRRAIKLQEFLERMARGGSRPTEITRSVFGVTPPDYRLQRAEYVTGARGQVIISEVLNTAGTFEAGTGDDTSPVQGNMSGHAIAFGSGYPGKYFCSEHGIMLGILSVMPKPAYKDGIHANMLAKHDALDGLAWPQFGNLGEQPILNVEVYADGASVDLIDTFGYTPRYAQHKYMPNRVAGDFRDSLAYWTLVRDFTVYAGGTVPLDVNFINCDPTKDIFAVVDPDVNSLYAHVFHSIKTKRCFPKFGVPSI